MGVVGGLGGNYLINNGVILGFLLWMASNGALIVLQSRTRLYGLVLLHAAYLYLCVQGIARWSDRMPGTLPEWLVRAAHCVT
ncbi:hypothetical protein AS149_32070 [Burkholderia cenocepacia]|nr:hypothetical protein AS149_32070 [Burkholderia cenocepacia]